VVLRRQGERVSGHETAVILQRPGFTEHDLTTTRSRLTRTLIVIPVSGPRDPARGTPQAPDVRTLARFGSAEGFALPMLVGVLRAWQR
jgi:hypothetical protein